MVAETPSKFAVCLLLPLGFLMHARAGSEVINETGYPLCVLTVDGIYNLRLTL